MVYFENKTRNHAKGFRIQKHLLPANESCVLVLQICCATDFRKTVIRFVARQVPRRIPPRKFGVPGRLAPFQSLSRRPPLRSMPTRRIHRKTSRCSSQNCEGVRQTSAYNKHSSHRSPLTRADYPRNALPTSRNMYFLDTISPTGKAHFSALNHGGNYEKIEDWSTRDAYCVRNGRLPGPRCLLKRAH